MGLIGILDSGLGGLTIAAECQRALPTWDFLYLGDTANAPYGNKSPGVIADLVIRNIELLMHRGVDAIVLACTTACAAVLMHRKFLAPIPLFNVICPGVDLAIEQAAGSPIAVMATRATVDLGIYRQELHQRGFTQDIFEIACPLLASHIDEGLIDHPATLALLRDYLSDQNVLKCRILLLGCTHFAFVGKAISQLLGDQIAIVDPAKICADQIARALDKQTIALGDRVGRWSWEFTDCRVFWRRRAEGYLDQLKANWKDHTMPISVENVIAPPGQFPIKKGAKSH